ncbi:MAG: WD40 repeat domain-containing protein [Sulfurimonas sp.]|nr:WD40 repeat domain-containing protein [Sulfurimonas sp.]
MFHIENLLEIDANIEKIQVISQDSFAYSANAEWIKILETESSKQIYNLKIKNNKKSSAFFCFSPNKKRLVYVIDNYIYVLDTLIREDNTKLKSVDIINKIAIDYEVTSIAFEPNSVYFFVGTHANELIQYKHNSSQAINKLVLFEKLKKRTKGISAISFLDSQLIVSGNRGDIVKIDIFSNIYKHILVNESVTVNHLLHLDEEHVLSSHANGDLRIIDTNKMNLYTKIDTVFTCIYQTLLLKNKRYALVCGDLPSISLVDLKYMKTAMVKYITFTDNVKQIAFLSEYLLLALLENNTIVKVNLPTPSQLTSLILHNSLDAAYTIVEKDVLLFNSKEYEALEFKYETLLQRATQDLSAENRSFAKQTLSLFENVACKKNEIQNVFKAFDNYKQFQNLFFEKEYSLAYNLVSRYPAFKNTPEYSRMEYLFKQTLAKAQICLVEGRWAEADSLLRTYKFATSKKAMVNLFLNHGTHFLKYLDILKNRDMNKLKKVAEDNEVFAQYLIYFGIKFEEDANTDTSLIDICLYDGEVDKVEKLLVSFEEDEQHLDYEMYRMKCQYTRELYNFYESHDFQSCYNLIDKHDFLLFSKLGKSFTKYWRNLIAHVEIDALNGEFNTVEKKFLNLRGVLLREKRIENLIKLAYRVKIDKTIVLEDFDSAQELVKKYITKFSKDEYILKKLKIFEVNNNSRFPNMLSTMNRLKKIIV